MMNCAIQFPFNDISSQAYGMWCTKAPLELEVSNLISSANLPALYIAIESSPSGNALK